MSDKEFKLQHHLSDSDIASYQELAGALKETPIPDNEVLANLGLFLSRSSLGRILFFDMLYQNIIDHHGVVMEFGVRWGQTLALLISLRTLYEPFNTSRKIIGFDTFTGFPSVDRKDGDSAKVAVGSYSVTENYQQLLEKLLATHERLNPKANVKKFQLVRGDVSESVPEYLEHHPETIVSLAYFDLDLYQPTRDCLAAILPYCASNTILAFDELCYEDFPGESIAVRELLRDRAYTVHRSPLSPQQSYIRLG